jgi:hypothetical protein
MIPVFAGAVGVEAEQPASRPITTSKMNRCRMASSSLNASY